MKFKFTTEDLDDDCHHNFKKHSVILKADCEPVTKTKAIYKNNTTVLGRYHTIPLEELSI